jgi:hypothetical protein
MKHRDRKAIDMFKKKNRQYRYHHKERRTEIEGKERNNKKESKNLYYYNFKRPYNR